MQVQLTEAQAGALRELAAERRVSISEVVRGGVDMMLESRLGATWEERRRRALRRRTLPGGGGGAVSEEHDRYLAEAHLDWPR
jgi:Arc/MetJ-type ribon-helix-helix transcriptional regulator